MEPVAAAVAGFLRRAWGVAPNELTALVEVARDVLGAESAKVLMADYGLLSLCALGDDGPVGEAQPIMGTLAGRALSHGDVVTAGADPTMVYVPLTEGTERVGVLELSVRDWDDNVAALAEPVAQLLVLLLIGKRRYTDALMRSRRSEPLSIAAEMQWGLLPPLACAADGVALSGILEPAYSIGGDSFDYALDPDGVHFAIIDAVGHGLPAVLLSVMTINALRNARREGRTISDAYAAAGAVLERQFGESAYVTGQIGTLETSSGRLTWLNAGHPLPLLVRDGHVRELVCRPSWPMGLGGTVVEVAVEDLQRGDTVLFYTDGAVESRASRGEPFGVPRLIDHLAVAVQEGVAPAETVRRLSTSIVAYNGDGLSDDATLLVLEYHRRGAADVTTAQAKTGILRRVVRAVSVARAEDVFLFSGALTFYGLISIAPLVVVALWVTTLLVGAGQVHAVSDDLARLAPPALGVDHALRHAANLSATLGLVAVAAALWPATAYGAGLVRVLDRIGGDGEGTRWRRRGAALLFVSLVPVFVLGTLLAGYVGAETLGDSATEIAAGLGFGYVLSFTGTVFAVGIIYKLFPRTPPGWRDTFRGALVAAASIAILSIGYVAYLRLGANFEQRYASDALASVVLLGLWLYAANIALLIGYRIARSGQPRVVIGSRVR